MKKILISALTPILFASCALYKAPAVQTSTILDYSKYQTDGMFLSESNSVNFTYQPVGSVSSLQMSGYLPSGKRYKTLTEDVYGTKSTVVEKLGNTYFKATRESVLMELCKKAKEAEANGIINLQIKYISAPSDKYVQSGYEATGMAIKK